MTTQNILSDYPVFTELKAMADRLRSESVDGMFVGDDKRVEDFSLQAAGLHLDYSKHLVNRDVMTSLLELSKQARIPQAISALFDGEHVNNTEDRPALHMLLRANSAGNLADLNGDVFNVRRKLHTLLRSNSAGNLVDLYKDVCDVRRKMRAVSDAVNSGVVTGYTNSKFTDVVNIGIGGSDLGPRLVTEALAPFRGDLRGHYVANVDPADLQATLEGLDPATTLFVICSKSFKTEETLANGIAARDWMLAAGATREDLNQHFLAVTANVAAAAEFGIEKSNCLPMWDWVGGRYSVWSAVGLSCAIVLGWENYSRFHTGARAMDEHFRNSTAAQNMPVLLSLLEVWCCNFLGAGNYVVLPYDQSLRQLPDYLQQLTMESNGKSVTATGEQFTYTTAPVLWGSAGTIGQHSFHQLLHQGTALCPVDFVLPLNTHTHLKEQHHKLVANCLAQSRTLMVGRSVDEAREELLARGLDQAAASKLAPHLAMPGNRPNSVITMDVVSPENLGALLALYEHRTFASARIWGINPFDQWGVELGKVISSDILERLSGRDGARMDASTEQLIALWRQAQHQGR